MRVFAPAGVSFYRPVVLEPGTTAYKVLHRWMTRNYPLAERCEWCGRTDRRTHRAIGRSDGYTCNPADWFEFCAPCHMVFDGRTPDGERNSSAKLSEDDVRHIRELHAEGYTLTSLAEWFGVTRDAIGRIMRGEGWRAVV